MKTSKRIGLVDDEEYVRFSTKALLNFHNYEVELFESAESLLANGSSTDFDCIIVDFRMKGLSGLDLLKELKKRDSLVPALVVSGYLSASETNELSAAGAAAIMEKPVDTKELLAELARITGGPADE